MLSPRLLLDVTNAVAGWIGAPGTNNGFFLKGDNESFPLNRSGCSGKLSNVSLFVSYDVIPW